jgi:hypothetical protein
MCGQNSVRAPDCQGFRPDVTPAEALRLEKNGGLRLPRLWNHDPGAGLSDSGHMDLCFLKFPEEDPAGTMDSAAHS